MPHGYTATLKNIMTKFMINNRAGAWKTDAAKILKIIHRCQGGAIRDNAKNGCEGDNIAQRCPFYLGFHLLHVHTSTLASSN